MPRHHAVTQSFDWHILWTATPMHIYMSCCLNCHIRHCAAWAPTSIAHHQRSQKEGNQRNPAKALKLVYKKDASTNPLWPAYQVWWALRSMVWFSSHRNKNGWPRRCHSAAVDQGIVHRDGIINIFSTVVVVRWGFLKALKTKALAHYDVHLLYRYRSLLSASCYLLPGIWYGASSSHFKIFQEQKIAHNCWRNGLNLFENSMLIFTITLLALTIGDGTKMQGRRSTCIVAAPVELSPISMPPQSIITRPSDAALPKDLMANPLYSQQPWLVFCPELANQGVP